MAATYLARIANLCSDITVKLAAPREDNSVVPLRGLSQSAENLRNTRENYVPRRKPTVGRESALGSEASPALPIPEARNSEFASFKEELEALRLRMIDACLSGKILAIETSCEAFANNGSVAELVRGFVNEPVFAPRLHEAVTNAVRLLSCSESDRKHG